MKCAVCDRPISKGRLRVYPYGTTCSGPCFVTQAINTPITYQLPNGGTWTVTPRDALHG